VESRDWSAEDETPLSVLPFTKTFRAANQNLDLLKKGAISNSRDSSARYRYVEIAKTLSITYYLSFITLVSNDTA